MQLIQELSEIPAIIWRELVKASHQKKHSWRLPVLGTVGDLGEVDQRILVLRRVFNTERVVWFYTDRRSPKVEQLRGTDQLHWLFYDHKKQWQLRAKGEWFEPEPAAVQEEWRTLSVFARQAYAAEQAPGSRLDSATDGIPPGFLERKPGDTDSVFKNFMIVACRFDALDWLQLHRSGHRRAQFNWDEQRSEWSGQWLIP